MNRITPLVIALGLMVLPAAVGLAQDEQDDDDSLLNRPPFTAEMEAQLDAAEARSTRTDDPAETADPPDAPEDAADTPGINASDPGPAPGAGDASDDDDLMAADEASAVVSAPPPAPPAAGIDPDAASARNRIALLIFGLTVLVLLLVVIISGQIYGSLKRRKLHRQHRQALAHAHDEHPLGQPDPEAEALGQLNR